MAKRALSTTEYTVLGIVWRDGPCTTYAVMLRLAASPSSSLRKRASSTYSTVQKLTKAGLLTSVGDEIGKRGDRPIGVTPAGIEVLRNWLCPPVPMADAAFSNDLIRLRLNFIAALDAREQAALIDDALRALEELRVEQERAIAEREDPGALVAVTGLLYETRARIEWLRYVKTLVPISSSISR